VLLLTPADDVRLPRPPCPVAAALVVPVGPAEPLFVPPLGIEPVVPPPPPPPPPPPRPVPVLPVVMVPEAEKFRIVVAWADCVTVPFPLIPTAWPACTLIACPLVGVKVTPLPWTTWTLTPHWFRGMPGRHGLSTNSTMVPVPAAVWASAFQATELASRIAAVAVSTTTNLRSLHIGVFLRAVTKWASADFTCLIQTGPLPTDTKRSEWGFDLVYALVLRARYEAKCSFGRLNDDGAG